MHSTLSRLLSKLPPFPSPPSPPPPPIMSHSTHIFPVPCLPSISYHTSFKTLTFCTFCSLHSHTTIPPKFRHKYRCPRCTPRIPGPSSVLPVAIYMRKWKCWACGMVSSSRWNQCDKCRKERESCDLCGGWWGLRPNGDRDEVKESMLKEVGLAVRGVVLEEEEVKRAVKVWEKSG